MCAITYNGFILKITTVSQNLHHLSPKGKCTTLDRNSIQNGHPKLYSSYNPVSASPYPGSSMPCFPLPFDWGSTKLPGVPWVMHRVKRAGRLHRATVIPHLPVAPRSSFASRVSAVQPTPPFHRARSGALRSGAHRLVRSGIARFSCFHFSTPSGNGWPRAPRLQSTRRRLLMPKAASRNAPCSASQL